MSPSRSCCSTARRRSSTRLRRRRSSVRLLAGPPSRQAARGQSRPYRWENDSRDRRRHPCRRLTPLTTSYVPSDEGGNTSHGFKFRAPVGRYLHVTVKDGVQGTGGYLSGKPFVATVKVEPLQTCADVPRPGRAAVADRRSQGRFPVARRRARSTSRSAACCRISCSISRRRCGTSRGRRSTAISRTSSSSVSRRRAITAARQPGKPTYDSIDLGQYLDEPTRGHARPLPAAPPREGHAAAERRRRRRGRDRRRRDARGHAADPRHRPRLHRQAGQGRQPRRVRAVDPHRPAGRRRAHRDDRQQRPAVLDATTDATGRAQLPRPSPTEARREKTPLLILAQKDERHVVHAVPIERARARPLAVRYRRRRERARRRSSCRRTCSRTAASIGRARRRTSA